MGTHNEGFTSSVQWKAVLALWVGGCTLGCFFSRAAPFATLAEGLEIGLSLCFLAGFLTFLVARRAWIFVTLATVAPVFSLFYADFSRPGSYTQRPPIVLLTLDTFRFDHFGSDTPELQKLANEGLFFTNAVTTAPLTAPAHASALSGLEVQQHGLLKNGGRTDVPLISERLHENGWRTGAFVSSNVLGRHTGLYRGFQHYDDRFTDRSRWEAAFGLFRMGPRQRPGKETVERALLWAGSAENTFLWVHLYDAHLPYDPPKEYRPTQAFESASEGPPETRHADQGKAMYAAEIRWVDHLVGQLRAGLPENTRWVITADHGEALGEHDYWFNHGALLHEPALHIPMMVSWPGEVPPGSEEDHLFGITQISDWIGAIAGLQAKPTPLTKIAAFTAGQQNRRTKNRSAPKPQPMAAFRYPTAKQVVGKNAPGQYFNLLLDPWELHPSTTPVDRIDDIRLLTSHVTGVAKASSEEQEQLRALGYVE